ncbi:MAG: 4Fe-4S ferredoxin, partial [Deltaproteobacteria bacterium]|nr:4Fe-4S ferredoxin [Deltaproteobacteria bacterium]
MAINKVYFSDLRTTVKENLPSKLKRLMQSAGINDVIAARNLAAIKL